MPCRDGSEQHARVEHVVVEREVVARQLVQTGGGHLRPTLASEIGRRDQQLICCQAPGPVTLGRLLQLSVASLTGIAVHSGKRTQSRCFGHGTLLRESSWRPP